MGYDYHEDIKDFQGDADRDARYEAAFDYAVDERGEEVERERERRALDEATARIHEEIWPGVESALAKARLRAASGDWDEAVFHAARAFDFYIRTVLVAPIRSLVAARFSRGLTNIVEVQMDDVLKTVKEVRGGKQFAAYALQAVAFDGAEVVSQDLARFMERPAVDGGWDYRQVAMHETTEITAARGGAFVQSVDDIIGRIAIPLARRYAELMQADHDAEFAPNRVAVLLHLAATFKEDPTKATDSWTFEERGVDLHQLLWPGYVERVSGGLLTSWRLTGRGYGYVRKVIQPHVEQQRDGHTD